MSGRPHQGIVVGNGRKSHAEPLLRLEALLMPFYQRDCAVAEGDMDVRYPPQVSLVPDRPEAAVDLSAQKRAGLKRDYVP